MLKGKIAELEARQRKNLLNIKAAEENIKANLYPCSEDKSKQARENLEHAAKRLNDCRRMYEEDNQRIIDIKHEIGEI